MIRPLATFLRALDAARTAGTLARTVRVLARQLDNAHLLAASEGARADRAEAELADAEAYAAAIERSFSAEPAAHVLGCAENLHQCAASHEPGVRLLGNLTAREIAEVARLTLGQARRIAELEAQTRDWAELSGELAREQPADDALPSVLDAGEAPIPLALTDSAREAYIQRDRADALQRALQACEVELQQTRAQLRQTEAAAGAHIATIEALREQIAAAHRAAHAIAPADPPCQCGHPESVHGREGCGAPGEDTHACPCERFQVYGHHPRPAEQIPGVVVAHILPRLECSICPYVARELDEEAGDKCPNCGSKLAEVEPCDACGKPARGAERTDGPAPLCGDCARKHAPAPAPARSKIAGPWHVDPKDGDLVRDIVGQSPDFVAAVMRGETADFEARAWNWNTAIHVDEYRTEEDAKNGADQALRAYGWTLQDAVTEIEPPPPTRPSERAATRTT